MTLTKQQQYILDFLQVYADKRTLRLGIELDDKRHLISTNVTPKECLDYKSYWQGYSPTLDELTKTYGYTYVSHQNKFNSVLIDFFAIDLMRLQMLTPEMQAQHLQTFFYMTEPIIQIEFYQNEKSLILIEYNFESGANHFLAEPPLSEWTDLEQGDDEPWVNDLFVFKYLLSLTLKNV